MAYMQTNAWMGELSTAMTNALIMNQLFAPLVISF